MKQILYPVLQFAFKIIAMLLVMGLNMNSVAVAEIIKNTHDYSLTPITKNIYVIYGATEPPNEVNRGFRNNSVIIQTSAGSVVFDPGGSAYAGEKIANEVKLTLKSNIVAVFNSHAHGDHWLGNEGVRKIFPNVIIYGHPKMIKRLEGNDGLFWLDMINTVTKNTAQGNLVIMPDKAVSHDTVIKVGDTHFKTYHTGPAHTDNDLMIEIVEENVLFMGDVVRTRFLGIMGEDSSFIGNIAAIEFILKKNITYYIPGHGKIGTNEVPKQYLNYLKLVYSSVKKLFLKDIPDYEMKPELLHILSEYRHWPGFKLRFGSHISRAYLEVEENNF